MFGLNNLVFVRDYVQGLQSQPDPSAYAYKKHGLSAQDYLGARELPNSKGNEQRKENIEVETSPESLRSSVTRESCPARKRTETSLSCLELNQGKSFYQKCIELVPKSNVWNPPQSVLDLTYLSHLQKTAVNSEQSCSSEHHVPSASQQVFSAIQQRKGEHEWKSSNFKEHVVDSSASGALPSIRYLPLSNVPPFPSSFRNRDRTSNPIGQSDSRLRRLSPLRESGGTIHRSVEIEQQTLVVPKTRKATKSVLHPSKSAERLYQSVVRKHSLKSLLSLRSSFAEDYTNGGAFLGRYRTPSAPELRLSPLSNSLHQFQPLSRASSSSSLRHLRPDKERSLYIGVNNHRLFLPSKSGRSYSPIVKYRLPLREERKTPSMTPYAIIVPVNSDKLPIAMASATPVDTASISVLGSAGVMYRSSSDVSVAGSMSSSDSDVTLIEGGESDMSLIAPNSVNPAQSRMANFFDSISNTIILQKEDSSVPIDMLLMINSFQVQPFALTEETGNSSGNSSQVRQAGFYHEFSPSMSLRRTVSVDSKTSFSDELSEEISHGHVVSGYGIRLAKCKHSPCDVLTDHDEAYACWHPESVDHRQEQRLEHIRQIDQLSEFSREFESSFPAGVVRSRAQRSVSFAEGVAERATTRQQSAVYRHSASMSDQIHASPLISPRLRGASFSKKFEEHMLTLPMPPVEHSVPFVGRRSSTVSATPSGSHSVITLSSKKSKGFWAKLGAMFKDCFGGT